MNNQNRTKNGHFATAKEAQRSDCREMIARYKSEAKGFIQIGNLAAAQHLVNKCSELRAAFFADYDEAV